MQASTNMDFDYDVIVLGDYCLDLVFTGLDSMPILGAEIQANGLAMEPGGACNSALALHRLGVKTAWAVEFGTDDFSKFVLKKFRDESFPEDLFVFSSNPVRKITVALSYPHERAFIAYYDEGEMIPVALKGVMAKSARIVLIPSLFYGPALQMANLALHVKDSVIFMDGNNSSEICVTDKRLRNALKITRIFSVNSKEARSLTQSTNTEEAVKILGQYCQTVIVKDGANGSFCCDNGQIFYEPGIKVKAVDTTGAGDLFNAGFIKAWLDQKTIQECLKWGNIVGGLSTTMGGANGYHISAGEIENIISERAK